MALTHSSELQIGRIYSPLTISSGITVQGNVPDVQQYDVAANLYEPDYTDTNLVLQAAMDVSDPDGVIPDGPVTLSNIKWTLVENKVETVVTSSTPGMAVGADGTLVVSRNCNPDYPMCFRCEAEYLDPRTGDVYYLAEDHMVYCESVSARQILKLDTSGLVAYDPLRDGEKVRKVKASLTIGGQEVAASERQFVWQKRDKYDGIWADIDGSDIMDYDVEVSADTSELTIKPWLVGDRIDIRCYAKYNPYGNPSAIAIDDRTPMESFAVVRIIGKLRAVVTKCPTRFKTDVKNIYPELVIMDSKGIVPNPDKVCDIEWRTSTGNAAGTVTKSAVVAYGSKPTIPTSFVANRYGGKLLPYYGAKDPLGAIKLADGSTLVDGNGNVIIA